MGLISQLATTIDESMIDYVQTVFTAATSPLSDLLQAVGIVGLLYLGLNQILQFQTVNLSSFLFWGIRYMIIVAFVTIWANFKGMYDVFVGIPDGYSAILISAIRDTMPITEDGGYLIDPSVIRDTYTGMDEFGNAIVNIAYEFLNDLSFFNLGKSVRNIFLGVLILIIGGGFIAACAITVIVAKVGFAVAISLAPLAIVMLMLEQTRSYFQSWVQLAVSFLVLPLLTSALMSIILYLASQVLINVNSESSHQIKYFGFILIMLSALYLLFKLPMMAGTLASTSVAAAGASTLKAGAMMAGGLAAGGYGLAKSGAKKLHGAARRARDAVDVGRTAYKGGASKSRTAWAMLNGMRQSASARRDRRDQRLARRLGGGGQPPGWSSRGERARGSATGANDTSGGKEKLSAGSQSTNAWENSPERKRGASSSSTSGSKASSPASSSNGLSPSENNRSSSAQSRSSQRATGNQGGDAGKQRSGSATVRNVREGRASQANERHRTREPALSEPRHAPTDARPVSRTDSQRSILRTDSQKPSSSSGQRSDGGRRFDRSEKNNGSGEE